MINWLSDTTHALYKQLVKPIFWLFDAEVIHEKNIQFGQLLGHIPPMRSLIAAVWSYHSPKLQREFHGILFPNPIGLSAGFDYNGDLTGILPAVGFGFHSIGTVTLHPYAGNPYPRLGRYPRSKALLINKGLKNDGAVKIIHKLRQLHFEIPTGVSIASTNQHFKTEADQIADIVKCFHLFEKAKLSLAYYELNISCPNTFGGEPFTTPVKLARLLKEIDQLKLSKPLFVKMPIDQSASETMRLLKVLSAHQVEGVIFGNLTKDKTNPAVHPADQKNWQKSQGNLSGKPTWHRSNRCIALTRRHFGSRFTIVGTGGVFSARDAAIKLAAGADLVQLITGMIYEGPQLIGQINRDLAKGTFHVKHA
jgi:dihydroorotate dehydrogenase subfamily 2